MPPRPPIISANQDQRRVADSTRDRDILSDKLLYKNSIGLTIVGYFDRLATTNSCKNFVIVPPGYGETKKDYISLSYYLVSNGFGVIRYDNTCHVGESQGHIINADLLKIQDDLIATLSFVQKQFQQDRIAVVATSLAARLALRVASQDRRVGFLCFLVGLVNLRETLKSIYRQDIIEQYNHGRRWETLDIFGHEVEGQFIKNAIEHDLTDLNGTLEDVKNIECPMAFIAAEKDAWISLADIKTVVEEAKKCSAIELHQIPGALHQLQENPRLAKSVIEQVALSCCKYFGDRSITLDTLRRPKLHDIVAENKHELGELKKLTTITKPEEREFWNKYLSEFSIVLHIPDYQDLLEVTRTSLQLPPVAYETVLDAGCGNGHFGIWLLESFLQTPMVKERGSCLSDLDLSAGRFHYIGVDFVDQALLEARRRHAELLRQLLQLGQQSFQGRLSYILSDLEEELPFSDRTFDKICCNLVISYVEHGEQVIRELRRVLKEGGKIAVSSLKPYCDLSLIYKDFTEVTQSDDELSEAIRLLSNTGKIRQKESEGHYHFYTEEQLSQLLELSGFSKITVSRTCGNQVNVAVAER